MFNDIAIIFKQAVRILARDRWKFFCAVMLCIAAGVVELVGVGTLYPFLSLITRPELVQTNPLVAAIYNYFGFADTRQFLIFSGVVALVSFTASNLFLLFKNAYLVKYCITQMAWVSTCLLESYLHKPMLFHLNANSGAMSKDVIEQSDTFTNSVLLSVTTILSDGFILSILVLFLVYLDPKVSVIVMVLVGSTLAALLASTKSRINDFGRASDEANAARFSFVISSLQAIKEIKTFGKEGYFVGMFSLLAIRLSTLYSKVMLLQLLPSFLIQLISSSAVILLALYYIVSGVELAKIVPALIMYAVVGFRIMPSLTKLANAVTSLRQNQPIVGNVCSLLSESPGAHSQSVSVAPSITDVPTIEFNKIGFRYNTHDLPILSNLTFKVDPRTLVGLVGPSGAGKTTISDLMLGLFSPNHGEILLNGTPLKSFDRQTLKKVFAYVHQSALILDASIAGNIAFGIPADEIDWGKIDRVVKLSHLDSIVEEKANRLNTQVGERGSKLSGGQRQRVGIARALYVEPLVLVLDESTNALDGVTESSVIDTLIELRKIMTVFVIAHSKSLMSRCDRILMIDNGAIVADGTFKGLMDNSLPFRTFMSVTK